MRRAGLAPGIGSETVAPLVSRYIGLKEGEYVDIAVVSHREDNLSGLLRGVEFAKSAASGGLELTKCCHFFGSSVCDLTFTLATSCALAIMVWSGLSIMPHDLLCGGASSSGTPHGAKCVTSAWRCLDDLNCGYNSASLVPSFSRDRRPHRRHAAVCRTRCLPILRAQVLGAYPAHPILASDKTPPSSARSQAFSCRWPQPSP
jgi:hypothetical protein